MTKMLREEEISAYRRSEKKPFSKKESLPKWFPHQNNDSDLYGKL
jgi:hypothetical protein